MPLGGIKDAVLGRSKALCIKPGLATVETLAFFGKPASRRKASKGCGQAPGHHR